MCEIVSAAAGGHRYCYRAREGASRSLGAVPQWLDSGQADTAIAIVQEREQVAHLSPVPQRLYSGLADIANAIVQEREQVCSLAMCEMVFAAAKRTSLTLSCKRGSRSLT